jgi:GTP-binding protein
MKHKTDTIRNIAIIAHVDHGKTTLVDQLFRAAGTKTNSQERAMDTNDIERERGITILAKSTGIRYKDYKINIVDTPGHSDFGGEVERTLQMVEGFILLVDAAEGVLPGTRFVLSKALALQLKPLVVINKVDRQDAEIKRTEHAIQNLFLDLATHTDQLEFPVLYGSSKLGFFSYDPDIMQNPERNNIGVVPLLETIIDTVPAPHISDKGLQFLCTNIGHSDFLGSIAIGRIFSGSMNVGQRVVVCKDNRVSAPTYLTKIYTFEGLDRIEQHTAVCGDIVALTGLDEDAPIGSTICDADDPQPLTYVAIDEPTMSINISVNDSPFNGREGKILTSRHIKARLEKECKTNIALRVEQTDSPDTFKVSGRGQLHLSILIENMRREGFEMQISAPEVIYKYIDDKKYEPIEWMVIDVPEEYQGIVMEGLGKRKAILQHVEHHSNGRLRMDFAIPSRGLIGFKNKFLTDTRGTGILTYHFHDHEPYKGDIPVRTRGALVSIENGAATAYALDNLQNRGTLFITSNTKIYEGMIVGEHSRDNDLGVNPCKLKKLTNMRASGSDDTSRLSPPHIMNLEASLEWINDGELIEVTPLSVRLRKTKLKAHERK